MDCFVLIEDIKRDLKEEEEEEVKIPVPSWMEVDNDEKDPLALTKVKIEEFGGTEELRLPQYIKPDLTLKVEDGLESPSTVLYDCPMTSGEEIQSKDLFTTMVDVKWRWTFIVFALSFLTSWFFFAVIWWVIAITHGDLEPEHKAPDSDWVPCVLNINGFISCFLYSMEVQTTIGFGGRVITEECLEGIFMMFVQSIVGMMIQAFMIGTTHKTTLNKGRQATDC